MKKRAAAHGLVVAAAVAAGWVSVAGGDRAIAADPVRDGTVAERAGASCWGIKQDVPASADGIYWLQPDPMGHADRYYCDMTTDGGGWVLIGRGRDNWTFFEHGQGTPAGVRGVIDGPDAFAPEALDTLTIDALLGGGDVKDLADGVRVRRAADIDGTTWQELRWNFRDLTSWSWALNGGHRIDSFSIDGTEYVGNTNTRDSRIEEFGLTGSSPLATANNELRWFTFTWANHANRRGFSYGSTVQGGNEADDYLWENANEGAAIPFTQLFIRPRLTSEPGVVIPDSGLPATTLSPRVSDRHEVLQSGVTGLLEDGDTEATVDSYIQAFAEDGDRIYVGGKFAQVELGPDGALVDQPYLAAFDRDTGAWIDTFTPALDGTVWELKVVGGRLFVAGQFTNIDGVAGTSSLAAIDLATGDVDATWQADVALTGSTDRPLVRSMAVDDGSLYVGGVFTRITSFGTAVPMLGMARLSIADGTVDPAFRPNFDGAVYDIAVVDERVHVVGIFTQVNDEDRLVYASVDRADGGLTDGFGPFQPARPEVRQYQQAVIEVDGDIWIGGNGHTIQVVDETDGSLLKASVTGNRGGDTQAYTEVDGFVMHGSHANRWIFRDTNLWPSPTTHSRIDNIQWIGLFDADTREYVVDWVPQLDVAFNEGAWSLYTDADDCVWFGGDFTAGDFIPGGRKYLQGFSKFCQRDTVAPTVPTNPEVDIDADGSGVTVTWDASIDDRAGFIGYEVLRNDRVVSFLVYGETFIDGDGVDGDRYFIRAVDAEGNRSATTALLVAGADLERPTTPQDLDGSVTGTDSADLMWTASTDDVGVTGYTIFRNGVPIGTSATPGVSVTSLQAGNNYLQVQAEDAAGNVSFRTPPIVLFVDDQRPSTPQNLVAVSTGEGEADLMWTASSDDVGVTGYTVFRNGVAIETSATPNATVTGLAPGNNYLQVHAEDAAGNISFKTPPAVVVIDDRPPSTPQNLVGVLVAADIVDLTWTASTDNVGVEGYRIFRNGALVGSASSNAISLPAVFVPGNNYLQVQAEDAAGNVSFKTPPIVVYFDDRSPSTPQNLVGTLTGTDSADLTWDAATDNVGVSSYSIFRNGTLIETSATNSVTVTGLLPGNNYLQVRAEDAAGNVGFKTAPIVIEIVPADTQRPTTPSELVGVGIGVDAANLTWTASTDNVGVTGYTIFRNGIAIGTSATPGASVTGLLPGDNYIQVQAEDAAGNVSFKTAPIVVTIVAPDTQPPSTPQNLGAVVVEDDRVEVTWTDSTDNVGVAGYSVLRNGVVIATSPLPMLVIDDLPSGPGYIQVQAFDAAGNASFKTPPVVVEIP